MSQARHARGVDRPQITGSDHTDSHRSASPMTSLSDRAEIRVLADLLALPHPGVVALAPLGMLRNVARGDLFLLRHGTLRTRQRVAGLAWGCNAVVAVQVEHECLFSIVLSAG